MAEWVHTMRFRRGYTLVELMIVLTVGTAMLMIAVSVLYLLQKTQGNLRQRLSAGRSVARLADQFRGDVHAASRIERGTDKAAPAAVVWNLDISPDTVVVYQLRAAGVRRVQIASSGRIQDDFPLPPGMGATITAPEGPSTLAVLRLEAGDVSAGRSRPVVIEALLGLDRRHSPAAAGRSQ